MMRRRNRRDHRQRLAKMTDRMTTLDLTNLLQVIVTVVVAILIATAALVGSAASGTWQQALREEIRWSAAATESATYLYASEAPLGFRLMEMDEISARLSAPGAASSESARIEALTRRRAAFELRRTHENSDHLVTGDRYLTPDGYDVARRLVDLEREWGVAPTWEATSRRADQYRGWAVGLGACAIFLVLAYPIAHLRIRAGQRRRRRRDPRDREVGIVPRPSSGAFSGVLGWVVFAAWTMVALLPGIQLRSSMDEQREQALAGATATRLTLMIALSNSRSAFATTSAREATITAVTGLAREFELVGDREMRAQLLSVARVEQDVEGRLVEIADFMASPPTAADGAAPELAEALTSTRYDWTATLASQQRHAAEASHSGAVAGRLEVASLLAALALTVGTLATVTARARIPTGAAAALLVTALSFAVPAVFS